MKKKLAEKEDFVLWTRAGETLNVYLQTPVLVDSNVRTPSTFLLRPE